MRNHLNGGCVTIIDNTISDETKLSEQENILHVDDILNIKEDRKDPYDEGYIETDFNRNDADSTSNTMDNSNDQVGSINE